MIERSLEHLFQLRREDSTVFERKLVNRDNCRSKTPLAGLRILITVLLPPF